MADSKKPDAPELESTLGHAEWSILRPHSKRGALFIVSHPLELLEVARAVADDDTARVSTWLASGKLTRPTPEQLTSWDSTPSRTFESIVVAPYVLMREIDS
jgi:hypothetical protein